MVDELDQQRDLQPIHYHRELLAYIRSNEVKVWDWAMSQPSQDEYTSQVREMLLKSTYRLEAATHPIVVAQCEKAMEVLGIDVPFTLYQIADGQMNASLFYIPGEVHIVFYGAVLEKLDEAELLALLGHELAHYDLWSRDEGVYHAMNRILDHTLSYPNISDSLQESVRLSRLFTELYADRGAALVCGSAKPAIATLVKVMTGLSTVDADAYLRQAKEIETLGKPSEGDSHPEMFLRAQAVTHWYEGADELEVWLDEKVRGEISLATLDLLRQAELTQMSHSFLDGFVGDLDLESDAMASQLTAFKDAAAEIVTTTPSLWSTDFEMGDDLRDYFFALIFDLAMADLDMRDHVLESGAAVAHRMKGLEAYRVAMKRDLKMRKPTIKRLTKTAEKATV